VVAILHPLEPSPPLAEPVTSPVKAIVLALAKPVAVVALPLTVALIVPLTVRLPPIEALSKISKVLPWISPEAAISFT
jgi:hypothetical protein